MSSTATPISPARFAAALSSLPLPNLHLKAAELNNSIAHLEYSNLQLQPLAEEGDRDCKEAVEENRGTIARMKERIELLKAEVEGRGFRWGEGEGESRKGNGNEGMNGDRVEEVLENGNEQVGRTGGRVVVNEHRPEADSRRRLGDEELARRLRERMAEDMDDDDDGLHL
ncbi:MAG: hypothetical protein Q9195_002248 [Heterodermia aff. obscurata]